MNPSFATPFPFHHPALSSMAWPAGRAGSASAAPTTPLIERQAIHAALRVGDLVFIRIGAKPFREVADATNSWTNHVGVVIDASLPDPIIAESTFPLSRATPLSKFLARSVEGRFVVSRLTHELTDAQIQAIPEAAKKRFGILYDTGFNLRSPRQFCSRFAHEVLKEATGHAVGAPQTFSELLAQAKAPNLGFWRLWYFGSIPWARETLTPASALNSANLKPILDGRAAR